jgi:anti-sigma B factor antagonist
MMSAPDGAGARLELLESGHTLVELAGEIDLAVVPDLVTELEYAMAQLSPLLVIDLDRVEFIDSSGLGALVMARRKAEELGGQVVLAGADEQLRDLLALTNLGELFAVYGSVPEALTALPTPGGTSSV